MKHTIYVSREGLSRCASCDSHFEVEKASATSAECPFCGAVMRVAVRAAAGRSPIARIATAGRSGFLAASLFGFAAVGAACDETEEPVEDMSTTITAQPAYGIPADTAELDTTMTEDAADMTVTDATSTTAVAEYGIAPDATDMEVQDADATTAVAEYGIAPDATAP